MIKKTMPPSPTCVLNLLIYVAMRDSKLLELRSKLESEPSQFKGLKIDFLFKVCQEIEIDLVSALPIL